MKTYNVGILSIGSGVGQSVVNSCRLSNLNLKTVGLGNNPFAYGLYDCDLFDYLPNIYQDNYIEILIEKCKKLKIDLLIPGLDDEALFISRAIKRFEDENIEVIVSGIELLELCRNKELADDKLNKISNIFVKSFSKQDFLQTWEKGEIKLPVIAKPRGGFASRGLLIVNNEQDFLRLNDDHIVQELALPHDEDPNRDFYFNQLNKGINPQVSEISIQLVADKTGNLLGRMASYNKLNNGVPIEILPFENSTIWENMDLFYPIFKKMGLKGPLNLQGRITNQGLKLFEMNARFTGITGLRALMGFNEVESCVKNWLDIPGKDSELKINSNKFGVRQTADKAISLDANSEVSALYSKLNNHSPRKKVILLTGATGYLGRLLVSQLSDDEKFDLRIFSRRKEKAEKIFSNLEIKIYDRDDFQDGTLSMGNVDIIIHNGFARPHCSNEEIAESLAFSIELFTKASLNQVPAIINISSQSVYGTECQPPWSEKQLAAPKTSYAQAKYAAELFLDNLCKINNQLAVTSIRLAGLAGGQAGLVMVDVVSKFVCKALKGEPIKIVGGDQKLERLDVRDAASAISRLLEVSPRNWQTKYNVGFSETIKVVDLAKKVIERSKNYSTDESELIIEKNENQVSFGLDCDLFNNQFNWKPEYDLIDTIDSLLDYCKRRNM